MISKKAILSDITYKPKETKFLKGMVTNLLMSDRLSGPYSKLDLNKISKVKEIDFVERVKQVYEAIKNISNKYI